MITGHATRSRWPSLVGWGRGGVALISFCSRLLYCKCCFSRLRRGMNKGVKRLAILLGILGLVAWLSYSARNIPLVILRLNLRNGGSSTRPSPASAWTPAPTYRRGDWYERGQLHASSGRSRCRFDLTPARFRFARLGCLAAQIALLSYRARAAFAGRIPLR